ncbi:antitoxin Xre/MbcA/ParS toxin-binding domain-containing protein [Glutamicibacter sp. NPDC087583]|uniref:antitoxin Xre/MbcA/ParS toxin-binding domain-containing protein n=1 Tax=Glutamicibacter sp. NPDC087583 TaxID=3363995 RepID=UPI0038181B1A
MPSAHTALISCLGPTLTAALTGGQGDPADRRLTVALRIFQTIEVQEGADLARAWMIGGNPALGGDTPITAIREERFSDVEAAVGNYLAG